MAQSVSGPAGGGADTPAELERRTDIGIRFTLSLLGTHCWERRWVLAMAADLTAIAASRARHCKATGRVTACCPGLEGRPFLSREANDAIRGYRREGRDLLLDLNDGTVIKIAQSRHKELLPWLKILREYSRISVDS